MSRDLVYRSNAATLAGVILGWLAAATALDGQAGPPPPTAPVAQAAVGIGDSAFPFLLDQIAAARQPLTIYEDVDSGQNAGFPSGQFGTPGRVSTNPACVPDPAAASGCATNPTARSAPPRGTAFAITFAPLGPGQFAGVNFEEPERWGSQPRGVGYDVTGASQILFDVLVPTQGGINVQFSVGGHAGAFLHLAQSASFQPMSLDLQALGLTTAERADLHLLFGVGTNDANAPSGGTLLLDRIRFAPATASQAGLLGLPAANVTHGVIPVQSALGGRVPIPPDQLLRNVATLYETAITMQALVQRGTPADLAAATQLADALEYAQSHPNPGIALPVATDGSRGLQSAFSAGALALHNDQSPGPALRGDIRLAGFSGSTGLCGPSQFCVVLDGATGGNNAFAIKALIAVYRATGESRHLEAARTLARWVHDRLADADVNGYGGYFLGYPDGGVVPKTLIHGKSTENNADLYSAFAELASVERALGTGQAALWDTRAERAGDFVMAMFDSASGRFFAGTVPTGTASDPLGGVTPDGPQRGPDVVNTYDFLDANTFSILALAESPRYRPQIDWRRPLQWAIAHQGVTVTAAGRTFTGFDLVSTPTAGPSGVAWEFTSQMVAAMQLVDRLYRESRFVATAASTLAQLRQAQLFAPFADRGLPAATLQGGDALPPYEHCLSTPFQCIAQRPGLAATSWAIFADASFNPLTRPDIDEDGLPNDWETKFGLDPASNVGDDGAAGDPDGDGRTNAQELAGGTHPRGFHQRYLAEGALNAFFDVRLALVNVGDADAHVQVRLLQPGGVVATIVEVLPARRRRTIARAELSALLSAADFSTVVEADQPIVVDRTMSWDLTGYGSHAETAVANPAMTWYLAEGSTSADFVLFYLVQNPNPTATTITVRYLLPGHQAPIERQYPVGANSRLTIPVDDQGPALASTDVSAVISAPVPIIAERAMYFNRLGQVFAAGHGSIGVPAPATSWFLAEGATGPFFDMFILLANPNAQDAQVTIVYLLLDGTTHTKAYVVPANSRVTVWVDDEQIPAGSGSRPLDNVAVSSTVTSTNGVPIIAERTMWWPSPAMTPNFWTEGHNSAGATGAGTRWALAEGEVGGPVNAETYILIANVSAYPGQARVTLYFEDGTSAERTEPLLPKSRTNVSVSAKFTEAAGRRFAAMIESIGANPAQLVVERAMYTSPGGNVWAAGTDALATRLP